MHCLPISQDFAIANSTGLLGIMQDVKLFENPQLIIKDNPNPSINTKINIDFNLDPG